MSYPTFQPQIQEAREKAIYFPTPFEERMEKEMDFSLNQTFKDIIDEIKSPKEPTGMATDEKEGIPCRRSLAKPRPRSKPED